MNHKQEIIIIGAGLTGLTLAYLLTKSGREATLLEASPRIGGRIQTQRGALDTPLELGATWFSDHHVNLLGLIYELDLSKYEQYSEGVSFLQQSSTGPIQSVRFPQSQEPSYRLVGGTQMLIQALSQRLDSKSIYLNTKVSQIREIKNGINGRILIETNNGKEYHSDQVIICLPPQLVAAQGLIDSQLLPAELTQLLPHVQTWMGGSIKFVLEYAEGFWRSEGYSGMVFTQSGIIREMYDHTSYEENRYGFTGFLNGGAVSYPQEQRKEMVVNQLSQLLGEKALNPITYLDKVWTDEFVFGQGSHQLPPHHNNGHQLLQESYLNGKLFFSCTETSDRFGGYMEGAIIAAQNTFNRLLTSQET